MSDKWHFPNETEIEYRAADRTKSKPNGHAKPVRQLATVWADEIEINLDAGGVVDGLMPRSGLTVLYGESGSGKTFNALDLACHVAAGLPWRGLDVEQGVG